MGDDLTDDNPWVIEFRSGRYFHSVEREMGVSLGHARRFPTMRAVDDFITENEWILFNGGMPFEVCAACLSPVAHRGHRHCKSAATNAANDGEEG